MISTIAGNERGNSYVSTVNLWVQAEGVAAEGFALAAVLRAATDQEIRNNELKLPKVSNVHGLVRRYSLL